VDLLCLKLRAGRIKTKFERKVADSLKRLAKHNDGASGIDRVTFEMIEAEGVEGFLDWLREALEQRSFRPQRARKVEIPKDGGKKRQLSILSIRDRMTQGALKLILEQVVEADFQPGSFGYWPKKTAHAAIQQMAEAIIEGKTYIIDLDLKSYFDAVKHPIVLTKVAWRVSDEKILCLLRMILKASGQGVPKVG
jgi:RNA-directed DNA polymerase